MLTGTSLIPTWFALWPVYLANGGLHELMTVHFLPTTQGKLKYKETVTNGFDNMFDAFVGLFKGDNVGKAVVKA